MRFFLTETYPTTDRAIFLFPRVTDHPGEWLRELGMDPEQVRHMVRLGTTGPVTHPKTHLKHHEEFLRLLREHLAKQKSVDIEARIGKWGAIAVAPRTREEFEASPHGAVLKQLPRTLVDRFSSVRGPRTLEEWSSLLSGSTKDTQPGLWLETGWKYGNLSSKPQPTRGVLHGIKVLDITRIIAGPIASLQLSQLGADVMRVSSADIFDYVGFR